MIIYSTIVNFSFADGAYNVGSDNGEKTGGPITATSKVNPKEITINPNGTEITLPDIQPGWYNVMDWAEESGHSTGYTYNLPSSNYVSGNITSQGSYGLLIKFTNYNNESPDDDGDKANVYWGWRYRGTTSYPNDWIPDNGYYGGGWK